MELKIDNRELVLIQKLKKESLDFTIEQLPVYDVIVNNKYGIELKKGNDFLLSIYDKRIFFQLKKMKKTNMKSLFIIYEISVLYNNAKNRNVINGMLLSLFHRGISIIQVEKISDVIYIIKSLMKSNDKKKTEEKINMNFQRFSTLRERKIALLSCAELVNIKSATLLIDKYKTIDKIIQNRNEISEIHGFGPNKTQNIIDLLIK